MAVIFFFSMVCRCWLSDVERRQVAIVIDILRLKYAHLRVYGQLFHCEVEALLQGQ